MTFIRSLVILTFLLVWTTVEGTVGGDTGMEDDLCDGPISNLAVCAAIYDPSVVDTSSKCSECVMTGLEYNVKWDGGCLEGENDICKVVRGCSAACGDCADEVEQMVRCLFDAKNPQCDDLQCDAVFKKYKVHIAWVGVVFVFIVLRVWCRIANARQARVAGDNGHGTELAARSKAGGIV